MKLFIIGNGFDIGHGLATKYSDFRRYLKVNHPEFLENFEKHYYLYSTSKESRNQLMLWNKFEENLPKIDQNIIKQEADQIEKNLADDDPTNDDFLYSDLSNEYSYIDKLPEYLAEWLNTISLENVPRRTSLIKEDSNDLYVNFNYTYVLEEVYNIPDDRIIHIHGVLNNYTDGPIIGHGDFNKIYTTQKRRRIAELYLHEKEQNIYKAFEHYYKHTYKDIKKFLPKLDKIKGETINEIIVIGHSVASVDSPYFSYIDELTGGRAKWNVYYLNDEEKKVIKQNLSKVGISKVILKNIIHFYDLKYETVGC